MVALLSAYRNLGGRNWASRELLRLTLLQLGYPKVHVATLSRALALIRAPGASFERHGALVKPLL
jgi:hypothetical protein